MVKTAISFPRQQIRKYVHPLFDCRQIRETQVKAESKAETKSAEPQPEAKAVSLSTVKAEPAPDIIND